MIKRHDRFAKTSVCNSHAKTFCVFVKLLLQWSWAIRDNNLLVFSPHRFFFLIALKSAPVILFRGAAALAIFFCFGDMRFFIVAPLEAGGGVKERKTPPPAKYPAKGSHRLGWPKVLKYSSQSAPAWDQMYGAGLRGWYPSKIAPHPCDRYIYYIFTRLMLSVG